MGQYYLALDIGGTKTTGAVFTIDGDLLDNFTYQVASRTFEGEEAVYQNIKGVLDELINRFQLDKKDILGIGVGAPGPLDSKNGIIIHAPLMGWKNFPIVQRLSEDFGLKVALDNDGNLGALAEFSVGVAKGISNMMYMTISTGCGAGLIMNSMLVHGFHDGAGEIGHMSIYPKGRKCPCGGLGCLEMYASGTAINRQINEDMQSGRIQSKAFEIASNSNEELTGKVLMRAASLGDEYALQIYEQEGYYLGIGLSNIINLLDPEVIVLGGGVTKAKDFFHNSMISTIKERTIQIFDEKTIRYSILNDQVVLFGAFQLIKNKIEEGK